MCGRFSNTVSHDVVKEAFGVNGSADGIGHNAEPRWNIAPSQPVDTVIAGSFPDENTLSVMRWGKPTGFDSKLHINARSETMFEKPTFRKAAETSRCIVVASGWFEWLRQKKVNPYKVPYYIKHRDDEPIGMAGLYWEKDGEKRCAIITTAADGNLAEIHKRAPLVILGDAICLWLNPETPKKVINPILAPTPAKTFEWYPVSDEINSYKNNHPGLIEPLDGRKDKERPQLKLL